MQTDLSEQWGNKLYKQVTMDGTKSITDKQLEEKSNNESNIWENSEHVRREQHVLICDGLIKSYTV